MGLNIHVKPQGGSTANASGAAGELIILNQLTAIGLTLASKDEHASARALLAAGYPIEFALIHKRFYRQLPAFRSIYGVPFKADFIVCHSRENIGLIEMKWQVTAGSVDEKLPFWLHTLQQVPDNVKAMLVVIGGGVRKGAIKWVKDNSGKTIVAFSFPEVQKLIRSTWQ